MPRRWSAPPLEAVACAAVLAVALLGPSLPRIASHFLGLAAVDHFGTQWFYAFVDRQLREGGPLGHTDLLFYPWGKDIYLHTGANVLDALLCVPLRRLLGPVAGYNVFLVLGVAFTAWGFARFARLFVEEPGPRWVGALLFAASPWVLYEVAEGRPTQAILGLLPLCLAQAWRTGAAPGLRAPLLGGALLALLGYQYWFYAFFAGCSVATLGLWRVLRPPTGAGARPRVLGRFALLLGLALALAAPVALPILARTEAGGAVPGLLDLSSWGAGWLRPATVEGHPVALLTWQPWLGESGFLMDASEGGQRFVGHQRLGSWGWLLALALYLARPGRLDRGGWFALALPAAVLALGPVVFLGDAYLPNLPYVALAHALGFLRRLWWPARAFAVLDVLLVLALLVGLARLWPRRTGPRAGATAALLAAWLLGLHRDGLAPLPAWEATVPPGYRCLAQGEPGAIIELPWGWSQAHLYYQDAHGRPMLGGMLERNPVFSPPEAVAFRARNSFVASLIAATGAGPEPAAGPVPADLEAARALGFRWVVFQRDALLPHGASADEGDPLTLVRARRTRLRRVEGALTDLLGAPVWADARTWIWPLPGSDGGPGATAAPCAADPPAPAGGAGDMIEVMVETGCVTGSVRCLAVRSVRPRFGARGEPGSPGTDPAAGAAGL